jgi:hypothetical protein
LFSEKLNTRIPTPIWPSHPGALQRVPRFRRRRLLSDQFQPLTAIKSALPSPIVFGLIFILLYTLFQSVMEAIVLILPTDYAMIGGLLLQYMMGFNFSIAVRVGYIALFGIAVETGVVMVIYLHEALNRHIAAGTLTHEGIELAVVEGAVQRLRPKLMTVAVVMLSLAQILWEERHRFPRDEAHRRTDSRRNDHLDDSCSHTSADVLYDHERAGAQERNAAVILILQQTVNLIYRSIYLKKRTGIAGPAERWCSVRENRRRRAPH